MYKFSNVMDKATWLNFIPLLKFLLIFTNKTDQKLRQKYLVALKTDRISFILLNGIL